ATRSRRQPRHLTLCPAMPYMFSQFLFWVEWCKPIGTVAISSEHVPRRLGLGHCDLEARHAGIGGRSPGSGWAGAYLMTTAARADSVRTEGGSRKRKSRSDS